MKKTLLFLLLFNTTYLFAQKPNFFFPKYEYKTYEEYEQSQAKIFKELKKYQSDIPLNQKEKNTLISIQESKQIQKGEENLLFDFDKDNRWDLLLVKGTYFGPSPGFQFYVNTKNGIEFICENAGDILKVNKQVHSITLYYKIPIFDSGEADVLYILNFVHKKQTYTFHKIYYAQQTNLPQNINPNPKQLKLKQKTALRFSPEIKNEGLWKNVKDNEDSYLLSTFIKGNIIAYYEANTTFLVLAEKEKWQFVAFLPESKASKISLTHGIESWKTTNLHGYVCGWIEK